MSRTFTHAPYGVRTARAQDRHFEHWNCALAYPHDKSRFGYWRKVTREETLPARLETVVREYGYTGQSTPPEGCRSIVKDGKHFVEVLRVLPEETITVTEWVESEPSSCGRSCHFEAESVDLTLKYRKPTWTAARERRVKRSERQRARTYGRRAAFEYETYGDVEDEDLGPVGR